jgi:hypothetical protein
MVYKPILNTAYRKLLTKAIVLDIYVSLKAAPSNRHWYEIQGPTSDPQQDPLCLTLWHVMSHLACG